jgi:hypothetical protein
LAKLANLIANGDAVTIGIPLLGAGATGYASAQTVPSSALAEPVAPDFKTRS